MIGGCATKAPSLGDKMIMQSRDATGLGNQWNAGYKNVEKGRELKIEGQKQVERAQNDLAEGLKKIKEGETKIDEGSKAMEAAEKAFSTQFPGVKVD